MPQAHESDRHLNSSWGNRYDHQAQERRRRVLHWMIRKIGFRVLMKFNGVAGLENFPESGSAILMINHIAFVDPVVVMGSVPRMIVPMAKIEAYDVPVWGIFPKLWGVIPVSRGELDRRALRMALEVLSAGEVILVAPEGTRGKSLGQGREGVAYLAAKSGAPVIPVAIEGTKGFPSIFPLGWWKPGASICLGRPFRFRQTGGKVDRDRLRLMTDEAMYLLSAMLPESQRGYYSDLSKATQNTIEFA
jgi:1-acyl-sn-glycerol-3-phosphate acyltransferase